MTVVETLLIYAGIPLAFVAVLALLTLRPDPKSRRARYRPGQPWEHEPVWYVPHPEHGPGAGASGHGAPGHGAPALGAGAHRAITAGDGHDSVRAAGPLGGARGTW